MRSAVACVLFALIIHKRSRAAGDEFRPTPIPLNEWQDGERDGKAGTLHENIKTESPPTVAAVPAHYWEDALRHSVYLTLVRDKIDQLIAKGDATSSSKTDKQVSKEVDDRDLWEKIKTAPFDRIPEEDPSSFGDVAIMAMGRLLEENDGYRFTEDKRTKEKCNDDKCMDGVKAIWSVKRIRQRDQEMSPGRYHYELTFSVISQTPKKQKKPYENPIRTFTVRESTPDRITEAPQEHRKQERVHPQVIRPERAVWIHKNIVPTKYHLGRSYYHGLDRIFSSLFSDDDDDVTPPESTARHKSNAYIPQGYSPFSKTGYVGAPTDQHQQNIKYMPYVYKQPVKNVRPLPAPPLAPTTHHYLDADSNDNLNTNLYNNDKQYNIGNQYNAGNQHSNGNQYKNINQHNHPHNNGNQHANHYNSGNQYSNTFQFNNAHQHTNGNQFNNGNFYNGIPHTLQSDPKYLTSNKPIRTTRPAVLPTPLPPIPPTKDLSFDIGNVMKFSNETTHIPETITIYKNYNKFRAPSGKVNYFTDHIRPPIYNAPPGVFVTMDKKPFKPMPPLKHVPTSKPLRNNRPIDFRPSPQILENQSTDQDSFVETAFRPITTGYTERNYTDDSGVLDALIRAENKLRKTNATKKPAKTKTQIPTTNAPDIITAANVPEEDNETMEWANLLGAFSKTTPMASPTEKINIIETTTLLSTTESISTSTTASNAKRRTTTTTEAVQETSTSTTVKPKKRTRPPPKFVKEDKIKKLKRVRTNSTASAIKATIKRPTKDLTPQASSAALSSTKSLMEITSKNVPSSTATATTSSTTSTTPTTTTTPATTTTTSTTTPRPTTTKSSTTTTRATSSAYEPKNKNRFRQSTLMLKGTSVKHDKWSTKNQTTSSSGKYPYRRKGSNFQGYLSSPTPDKEDRKRYHADRVNASSTSSTTEKTIKPELITQTTTIEQITENDNIHETTADQDEEYDENEDVKNVENLEEESKDSKEFIFQTTTSQSTDTNNDGIEENITSDLTVVTSPHTVAKNKTKCKKKKINNNMLNEDNTDNLNKIIPVSTTTTTTEDPTTANIFQELFDFNFGSTQDKENEISSPNPEPDEEESAKHEEYLKIDDEFKEFMDNLTEKKSDSDDDEHYDDDDEKESSPIDDEDSEIVNDDEKYSGRQSSDDEEDYQDRPYSFLELLAME